MKDYTKECRRASKDATTKYDWSKLEGSGWEEGSGGCITNGRFVFWPDNGEMMVPIGVGSSSARTLEEARAAYNEASALAERCRIDWKAEVRDACAGVRVREIAHEHLGCLSVGLEKNGQLHLRLHNNRTIAWHVTSRITSFEHCNSDVTELHGIVWRLLEKGWVLR